MRNSLESQNRPHKSQLVDQDGQQYDPNVQHDPSQYNNEPNAPYASNIQEAGHSKPKKPTGATAQKLLGWIGGEAPGPDKVQDSGLHYEEAFEMTGQGRFNYLVLLCCSLIFIHSLLETVALGYIITPSECDLRLTTGQKSLINSSVFIGIIFTAVGWGVVSDYYGRRKIMLPCLITSCLLSFLSSLTNSFALMFTLRIFVGCFVSATGSIVLVYLGELYTKKKRDQALSICVTAGQGCFVIVPAAAWLIIPHFWSLNLGITTIKPWRVYMWTWGVVGGVGAAILYALPESPRYLLSAKGEQKAMPVLQRMYATNFRKKSDEFPVKSIKAAEVLHSTKVLGLAGIWSDLKQLLRPPLLGCFILTHFGMFMVFFLANGLYIWMPDFINEVLSDKGRWMSICGMINTYYADGFSGYSESYIDSDFVYMDYLEYEITRRNDSKTLKLTEVELTKEAENICISNMNTLLYPSACIMESIYLAPFLYVNCMINRQDKTKLYFHIMIACSIGLSVCSFVPQIMVACLCMVIGLCSGGGTSILSALAVDAFPTSLRGLAMCTMYTMGQIGATAGALIVVCMNGWLCYFLFIFIAVVNAVSGFVLYWFWPNTDAVRAEMELRSFNY